MSYSISEGNKCVEEVLKYTLTDQTVVTKKAKSTKSKSKNKVISDKSDTVS
jgi:hypothetical protein